MMCLFVVLLIVCLERVSSYFGCRVSVFVFMMFVVLFLCLLCFVLVFVFDVLFDCCMRYCL